MLDIDYEILENLGTARRSFQFLIDELEDKSSRDSRLDDVIHGCYALLDEVKELEEEYADKANAAEDEDVYMMEDAS
ncbi:MAG: hypothetical protein IKK34_08355 [Clostridia bacterium]|nr:hypothetical protein [Clostridia bacterium]